MRGEWGEASQGQTKTPSEKGRLPLGPSWRNLGPAPQFWNHCRILSILENKHLLQVILLYFFFLCSPNLLLSPWQQFFQTAVKWPWNIHEHISLEIGNELALGLIFRSWELYLHVGERRAVAPASCWLDGPVQRKKVAGVVDEGNRCLACQVGGNVLTAHWNQELRLPLRSTRVPIATHFPFLFTSRKICLPV